MEIITWFTAHWDNILAIYAGLVAVASIIVKLTPTLADDTWLLAVIKFMSRYIALNRSVDDEEIRNQE